jgi:hypothetical protein
MSGTRTVPAGRVVRVTGPLVEVVDATAVSMLRGDQPADRRPAIGPHARRVLEFAQLSVLLVPPSRDVRGSGEGSR